MSVLNGHDINAYLLESERCSIHTQAPMSFSFLVTSSAMPPPPHTRMLALSGLSSAFTTACLLLLHIKSTPNGIATSVTSEDTANNRHEQCSADPVRLLEARLCMYGYLRLQRGRGLVSLCVEPQAKVGLGRECLAAVCRDAAHACMSMTHRK